jgi:hypothetical protein
MVSGIREAKAGGSGPVSLRDKTDAPTGFGPSRPGAEPPFRPRHAFNAPTLTPLRHLSLFRPVIGAPNPSRTRAKKPRTRCLDRRTEWTLWHPLGATGGTRIHSRRTGRRLGQLRCARQGLVRVPESNTKYGGKRGKTGVNAAPVMGPSISESSGIPKRKKFAPPL